MIRIELQKLLYVFTIGVLFQANTSAQVSVSDTFPSCYAGIWTYVGTRHFIYDWHNFEGSVIITNDSIKIRKKYDNKIVENRYDSCVIEKEENKCSSFSPLIGIRDTMNLPPPRRYSCEDPFYFKGDTLVQHQFGTYDGINDMYARGVPNPVRKTYTPQLTSLDYTVEGIYNLHGQKIKNGKIAGAYLISKNQKLLKIMDLKSIK